MLCATRTSILTPRMHQKCAGFLATLRGECFQTRDKAAKSALAMPRRTLSSCPLKFTMLPDLSWFSMGFSRMPAGAGWRPHAMRALSNLLAAVQDALPDCPGTSEPWRSKGESGNKKKKNWRLQHQHPRIRYPGGGSRPRPIGGSLSKRVVCDIVGRRRTSTILRCGMAHWGRANCRGNSKKRFHKKSMVSRLEISENRNGVASRPKNCRLRSPSRQLGMVNAIKIVIILFSSPGVHACEDPDYSVPGLMAIIPFRWSEHVTPKQT